MSTIRKKPYIEEVLATLNSTQLGQFNALLNGGSANVFKSLVIGSASPLSASDKGIKGVNLELELGKVEAGILIYTDNYCCFCNYHQYQDITVYDVDVANKNYARKYEGCTIEELRRIVGIAQAEAGGETEWEREIKEHLVYNSEDTQVECGVNFEVDGVITANEVILNDHFSIFSGSERFVDINTDNKTSSFYRTVNVGSDETQSVLNVKGHLYVNGVEITGGSGGDVYTDDIMSETLVGGQPVEVLSFNSTDNHWHLANTKVDDTLQVDGELELGSTGDLGNNMKDAVLEQVRTVVPAESGQGVSHINQTLVHITTGNAWGEYEAPIKDTSDELVGRIKFVKCTQAQYDAISTPDANTLYIIVG